MKLTDLDPKLTDSTLRFRCPKCGEHFIVIPVDRTGDGSPTPPVWTARGEVEDLTIAPSIDSETKPSCRWHGWIRNGEILNA
jgi:hypothetical protein